MFVPGRHRVALGIALATMALSGCSVSDYAREESLPVPVSADEVRAEAKINEFLSDLADQNFGDACRRLTTQLQLVFSAKFGSCAHGWELAAEEGGAVGEITVLGSDDTHAGLWVRTTEGSYLMHGDLIAYFKP